MIADSISGMTPTYTNSTQMDSYVAAFQLVKHHKSLIGVTPLLMEDTKELIELMQRSNKVGFSGPLCMKIQKNLSEDVAPVRDMEILIQEMQCR